MLHNFIRDGRWNTGLICLLSMVNIIKKFLENSASVVQEGFSMHIINNDEFFQLWKYIANSFLNNYNGGHCRHPR